MPQNWEITCVHGQINPFRKKGGMGYTVIYQSRKGGALGKGRYFSRQHQGQRHRIAHIQQAFPIKPPVAHAGAACAAAQRVGDDIEAVG